MEVKTTHLTWLGQAGFLLETAQERLLIDPWVSAHPDRLVAPPAIDQVADRIDFVLVTHEHEDHLDAPFLAEVAQRSPGLRVILPAPIAELAPPVLSITRVSPGDSLDIGSLRVQVVPAWHCVDVADGYSDGDGRFVGYVISGAGPTIYHAGDTISDPALAPALSDLSIDIALLPINGRDPARERLNFAGNLDAREAVTLAGAIGASAMVPYHWDGFAGNTERPGRAADEAHAHGCPVHVVVLAHQIPYRLA